MNYSEAIQFLYDLRLFGLKFGLENTRRLAAWAGDPQEKLQFIHVAGTNGKGSTCAMLESIYRAAGLRLGLFTSPHLVSFAERIQVNRNWIAPGDVARLAGEMKGAPLFSGGEGCPTFFEAVTVMALKYFAEQRCDLVIWETGLGGRLDATNIVTPLASVITNVQLDHQQWLGETIPEITREKAGIIKENVPIITAAEDADALSVIVETAQQHHAPLHIVTADDAQAMERYEIALAGEHQQMNAAVAARVAGVLNAKIPVSEDALRRGLKETQWAGRQQLVRRDNGQTVLLDGAHNPAGAHTLARAVAGKKFALILGIMRDKDCAAFCEILAPTSARIFICPIGSERTADPSLLAEHCRRANPAAQVTVCESLADAFGQAADQQFIVLTGSLYFVGEALEWLGLAAPSPERALNEYGATPVQTAPAPSIRAVTFDVGGTLIEPWPSVGDVYARVAARHGLHVAADVLNRRFAAAWKAKKNFGYQKSEWLELVNQTFQGQPTVSFFPELYEAFADPSAWRVYDDVRPCLERMKQSGIKLGIISNWDERLRPLLSALDLARYFDVIVVSSEIGHHKPEPEIFRAAASQLMMPPNAILHTGDSRREDFDGARAAGFQSVLLARGARPGAEAAIPSLDKLPSEISQVQLISF